MEREAFEQILGEYFAPMFPGTLIRGHKNSSSGHKLVAYSDPCTLLISPSESSSYRVLLKRPQPFKAFEKQLVHIFAIELSLVSNQPDNPYLQDLLTAIPRRVVARSLLKNELGRKTLQEGILHFERLAAQTYEGRPVVVAMGFTGSQGHGKVRLAELWDEDFSRVLSNGFDSMYVCGQDGRVFNLSYLSSSSVSNLAPFRLSSIAEWCSSGNKVALVLNRSGDILVFKDRQLQFSRRRGAWRYYPHESIIGRLGQGTIELRRAIYESCLDVSFARTGGCIAIFSKSGRSKQSLLRVEDFFFRQLLTRTKLLSAAVGKPFYRLDRRMRQELLGMDGAMVLDNHGNVLSAGAIVKVPSGSDGGGRRAAAVQLSRYGLGIKISADGPIEGFRQKKSIFFL